MGEGEPDADKSEKDDESTAGKITYGILFVFFGVLLGLGIYNFYHAYRIGKFKNNPILLFYISGMTVISFRLILFIYPLIDFDTDTYILLLVAMPTFLYLIVGLSQVMLSVDCIIKYLNLQVTENADLTTVQKKEKIVANKRILRIMYITLAIIAATMFAYFVG